MSEFGTYKVLDFAHLFAMFAAQWYSPAGMLNILRSLQARSQTQRCSLHGETESLLTTQFRPPTPPLHIDHMNPLCVSWWKEDVLSLRFSGHFLAPRETDKEAFFCWGPSFLAKWPSRSTSQDPPAQKFSKYSFACVLSNGVTNVKA